MGIKDLVNENILKVWEDIYDSSLDDKAAPNLSDIYLGQESQRYADPEAFFRRTYMTRSLNELLEEVSEALEDTGGGRIFLLTSLFGGGKTHTLISLYHAFVKSGGLARLDTELRSKIVDHENVEAVVMDGSSSKLIPHPDEPYKKNDFTIKTLWGMLAYRLGAYAKVKKLDNELAPAPDKDTIVEILLEVDGSVLILMDEIVHYIFNMYKSRLRDYGEKCLLFLDYLARAVEASPNVALVVSVHAEYRLMEGQKTLVEEDMFKGYAKNVFDALTRESTRIITPVSPGDVVKVLQKKIFREIPEEEGWSAQYRLYEGYREAQEIFGVESDWQFSPGETGRVANAVETYPFHPKYVEVLREFVTRNPDLQKTRDAIRLTRKVVRNFLRGFEDSDFIMPWHIDLRNSDIRGRVLTESYGVFRDVADRDIVSGDGRIGSVAECSKPQLALKAATSILLKTYTYETFKEALKVFPDLKTLALMVYEPGMFMARELQPSDIEQTLEEMQRRLPHFAAERGRYWFTPYPSVIEYVERMADDLMVGAKVSLYNDLKSHARDILVRKKSGAPGEVGEVFTERYTSIIGYGDEIFGSLSIDDDERMKLAILLKPDLDLEDIRNLMLTRQGGGTRLYPNTLAVVYPNPDIDFDNLLRYSAKIKAAEEVMDNLSEYYTDRDIRGLQEKKLKEYMQDNINLLNQRLLAVLTRVVYPVRGSKGEEIEEIEATPSTSIILQVETALKDPRCGPKLRTEFTFTDLKQFLENTLGWDLVGGDKRYEFRRIVEVFHTNTSAPFTTEKAVESAIIDGIRSLDIGVRQGNRTFWKRVGPEDGAEQPDELTGTSVILPFKIAAENIKEKLLSETGVFREADGARRVWYEVKIAGRRINLEDLVEQEDDWERILKESVILEREKFIPKGFILEIKPRTVEKKQGEEANISISIDPVGDYMEVIRLETDVGDLTRETGEPPFKSEWVIPITMESGEHQLNVKAIAEDGLSREGILTVYVLRPEIEKRVDELDLSYKGAKLVNITPYELLGLKMSLNTLQRLNVSANVNVDIDFGEKASFNGLDMDSRITRLFIEKFDEILRSLTQLGDRTHLNSIVKLEDPLILDRAEILVLTPLNDKARFTVRVKRER